MVKRRPRATTADFFLIKSLQGSMGMILRLGGNWIYSLWKIEILFWPLHFGKMKRWRRRRIGPIPKGRTILKFSPDVQSKVDCENPRRHAAVHGGARGGRTARRRSSVELLGVRAAGFGERDRRWNPLDKRNVLLGEGAERGGEGGGGFPDDGEGGWRSPGEDGDRWRSLGLRQPVAPPVLRVCICRWPTSRESSGY